MDFKRISRCREDLTKHGLDFGSPIMWAHAESRQANIDDTEESKTTKNNVVMLSGRYEGFEDTEKNGRESSDLRRGTTDGCECRNRKCSIETSKDSDKEKDEEVKGKGEECCETLMNIRRTIATISDSDEYDTDLEDRLEPAIETTKLTAVKETDAYLQACQQLKIKPLSCIADNLTKQCITLKNKSTGPKAIYPLCTVLRDNPHVERLNLDGVEITNNGIQHMAEMLIANDTITHLNLSNNNLGLRGAQAIGHVIVVTHVLTHLNLSGNKLNDESGWFLISGISSNTSLTHLDISYNEFGVQSGVLIGAALARNKTMTWFNLCWNKIYGRGAVAIFRGLMVRQRGKTEKKLHSSRNHYVETDYHDTSLNEQLNKVLPLQSNPFLSNNLPSTAAFFPTINTTIEHLDISWNGLGYEGSVALSKCLKVNMGLRSLNIANNRIDWRCAFLLAEGLRSNNSLSKLKIGFNPLTTTGVMDILEAVANGDSSVTFLDCTEIPVLGSADLLAATVGRLRSFTFLHGGIVSTHDKLGERVGRELNPMLRIIEYLRLLGLRPLELMKSFDRTSSFELPREEFIDQIKKIGVKLHPYEIEALANSVSGKGYNRNVINYRKLSLAVRDVVEAERRRKIKERDEWRQMKNYQNTILQRGTVDELINSTSSHILSEPLNTLTSRSNHTLTHSTHGSLQPGVFPSSYGQYRRDGSVLSRRLQKKSTKEIIF